uniref:DeSI-like protein At4g17486 n=1 Tax=Nelumbo nucifera TaxID=4432 RepID=A0A822ZGA3_NELNU|nr:TPA_asm: hypothetical protein HUJ06_003394 [Nelumbo nucifera]
MLCRVISRKRKTGSVPVYLNVYDLTPINGYAYWLGLGVYHSGVQGQLLASLSIHIWIITCFDSFSPANKVSSFLFFFSPVLWPVCSVRYQIYQNPKRTGPE